MAEKGDSTDNVASDLTIKLPLGSEKDKGFATTQQKLIREVGRILQSLGEIVEVEEEEKKESQQQQPVSVKDYILSSTKTLFETLGIILDWLEQSTENAKEEMKKETSDKKQLEDKTDGENKDNVDGKEKAVSELQKKEGVLRGLFHITELGSHTCFVGLLELVCKFLDMPDNPYQAKREHVKECLKEAEEKQPEVSELVEKACNIMQEIVKEPELNPLKADEFNSTVGQANVIIESCKDLLSDAEETIDELMKIMSTMKYFSRGLRIAGFGLTCYGIYHMSPSSSTVDSLASYMPQTGATIFRKLALNGGLKTVGLAASCAMAGYAWLSLFPSKAYLFRADLEELKLKHKRLTKALKHLERKLDLFNNVVADKKLKQESKY